MAAVKVAINPRNPIGLEWVQVKSMITLAIVNGDGAEKNWAVGWLEWAQRAREANYCIQKMREGRVLVKIRERVFGDADAWLLVGPTEDVKFYDPERLYDCENE